MKNYIKVQYIGNLPVYRIDIGGETYIFNENNCYTLMFSEDIAKELVEKNPNIYKILNDKKNIDDDLKLKDVKEKLEEKKVKGGEK